MKVLALLLGLALNTFAQFAFTYTPLETESTVDATANGFVKLAQPFIVTLPMASGLNYRTLRVGAPLVNDIDNKITSSMFQVGIAAANAGLTFGNTALVTPGTPYSVYLSVAPRRMYPGLYNIGLTLEDVEGHSTVSVAIKLNVKQASVNLPASNTRIISHVPTRFDWETKLKLVNAYNTPLIATVVAYSPVGEKLWSVDVPLQANATQEMTMASDRVIGSLEITGDGGKITQASAVIKRTGVTATLPGEVPQYQLTMPFDNTGGQTTGVAVFNSADVPVNAVLTTFDAAGNQLGKHDLNMAAKGQLAFVLDFTETRNTKGVIQIVFPWKSLTGFALPFSGNNFYTVLPGEVQ